VLRIFGAQAVVADDLQRVGDCAEHVGFLGVGLLSVHPTYFRGKTESDNGGGV
jgi:hypothetical protein